MATDPTLPTTKVAATKAPATDADTSAEMRASRAAAPPPRTFFGKLRVWLKGAFVDNAALKLVALVLSLTVFVLVHSERDRSIVAYVGLGYTMPEDRVLVSRRLDQVRVTIEGSARRIRRFDEREMGRIPVDLTQETDGEYVFDPSTVDLPEGLKLISISPSSMTLDFEPRIDKTVPVRIATVGRPARGYRVDRVETQPPQVAITGAEGVVNGIEQVRTREVSLDGRTESFRVSVALATPRSTVDFVDTKVVQAQVTITPDREQTTLEDVPVTVVAGTGLAPDQVKNFKVEPATVDLVVSGPVLALDAVDAGAIHVQVMAYPSDLTAVGPRHASITVTGLPAGASAEVTPSEVSLTAP